MRLPMQEKRLNFFRKKTTGVFLLLILPLILFSQNDTSKINRPLLHTILITETSAYAASLVTLNFAWYKNYPRSSFHFFNDNDEWMQMDKCGHATTAYYVGYYGIRLMNATHIERKKAIWYGGLYGAAFLTTIEILDGFSSQWGFSAGDFAANTLGSIMLIGQQFAWNEQRVLLKWSFHQTSYASYRKDLLGSSLPENMLKDYNGQSYWLSCNIHSFLNKSSNFPKWLNLAVGYGAEGMLGARTNPVSFDGKTLPVYNRYRKFYISPDIDLTRIHTRSKALNTFLQVFGFIKIPAPAIEFNSKKQVKGHLLYF